MTSMEIYNEARMVVYFLTRGMLDVNVYMFYSLFWLWYDHEEFNCTLQFNRCAFYLRHLGVGVGVGISRERERILG